MLMRYVHSAGSMQDDGNLVLYKNTAGGREVIWAANIVQGRNGLDHASSKSGLKTC